jgi:hypothetical protein
VSDNVNSESAGADVFWGEIAPCEHMVQFYEHDGVLVDTLAGFVGGGLQAGESAIVIATPAHLDALDQRLTASGLDVETARSQDHYIALDAEQTLARFVLNGWPDDDLFAEFVRETLARARGNGRRVRAFGEMVALLWARGDVAATVRLEYLWQNIYKSEDFSLFCAYPKVGFTEDPSASMSEICAAHSKLIQ